MAVGKGVIDVLKMIGFIAVALVGTALAMILVLILMGIMGDTVVPALGLGTTTVANITAVITTIFSFVGTLNSGLQILAALTLIVIVVAIFAGLGFMGYAMFKKGKGGSSGNM